MKGLFIEFVGEYCEKSPLFVQGYDFREITYKIEKLLFPDADECNLCWVDSDFKRDYDAWITVYYPMGSLEYKIRVKKVEEVL